jgi:hypothetical protein
MYRPRARRAYLIAVLASVLVVQTLAPDWIAFAYAWGLLCALAAIVWSYIGSDAETRVLAEGEARTGSAAANGS